MRYIHITFNDGKTYSLDAAFIADSRARYYAELDTGEFEGDKFDAVYKQEFALTINDEFLLHEWLTNNFDWRDIENHVTLIVQEKLDLVYQLDQAKIKVVETNS